MFFLTLALLARNIQRREPPNLFPFVFLHGKRLDLIALSNKLREAHLEIIHTSNWLRRESIELSEESRRLRNNGHLLRSAMDGLE